MILKMMLGAVMRTNIGRLRHLHRTTSDGNLDNPAQSLHKIYMMYPKLNGTNLRLQTSR